MPKAISSPRTGHPTFLRVRSLSLSKACAKLHPQVVSTKAELTRSLSQATKASLWISDDRSSTERLLRTLSWPAKTLGSAILFHDLSQETLPALKECFLHYAYGVKKECLPPDELVEALQSDRHCDLVIGGIVDKSTCTMTSWRGNMESLTVPFSAFETSGEGMVPDFRRFSVTDCGQTLRLGDDEAATDAILYEFDPEYRKRMANQRHASEQSIGASVRRLRKQRGKRREDFAPISAKTIARIEQGEKHKICPITLEIISRVLGVPPSQIESF